MPAAVAVAALAAVTACGGAAPSSGAVVPDAQLTVAMAFSPGAGYSLDTDDAFVLAQMGVTETLVTAGADGVAQPALATAWTQVDPLTWRFELRPDTVFHDGSPVTAVAVADALTWVTSVAAPPRAVRGIGLTATAEDGADGAVLVGTAEPDPILPLRLSSPNTAILAPSAYASTPPAVVGTGTGPMTLTAADGAQGATLVRNDAYWDGRSQLAGVAVTFVPDPAARALALRAGDVDIAQELPEAASLEFTGPEYTSEATAAPRTASLLMSQVRAPFDDVRVREAVALAVDRTALAEQALAGSAVPASELFGPAVAWGADGTAPAPDPAAAAALLAEAGYGPENPLRVELGTYAVRPELPVLAGAVQQMLAEAGIEATIQVGDYDAREPDLLAGEYDMYLGSRNYLLDVPDAAAVLRSDYTCEGSYNLNRYCSPAFDALLVPLDTETDPAARQEVFRAAARLLVDDVVGVPLVHTSANGTGVRVSGYRVDPLAKSFITVDLARTE